MSSRENSKRGTRVRLNVVVFLSAFVASRVHPYVEDRGDERERSDYDMPSMLPTCDRHPDCAEIKTVADALNVILYSSDAIAGRNDNNCNQVDESLAATATSAPQSLVVLRPPENQIVNWQRGR